MESWSVARTENEYGYRFRMRLCFSCLGTVIQTKLEPAAYREKPQHSIDRIFIFSNLEVQEVLYFERGGIPDNHFAYADDRSVLMLRAKN